jgi:hypothetical protein
MIKPDKNLLVSSILTLITVLVWIGFDVYRALNKTTITKVTQEQMKALDPKIKRDVIEKVKNNLYLNEEDLNQAVVSVPEEPNGTEDQEARQE